MIPNAKVAQQWAQRAYTNWPGRAQRSQHMFYRDSIIFSYGEHFPIAQYRAQERITLLTSRNDSVTTARHISHVRGVIEGAYVHVPDVLARSDSEHAANVQALVERIRKTENAVLRTRKYLNFHHNDLVGTEKELVQYCVAFKLATPLVLRDPRVTVRLVKARLLAEV